MNWNPTQWALRNASRLNPLDRRRTSQLTWNSVAPCPDARAEAASVRVGRALFVIGGYHDIDHVLDVVDVLDLSTATWLFPRLKMPDRMANTHLGVASDGQRYGYIVAGQKGPQCHPAVPDVFVLDAQLRTWSDFPPLPEARYSPTAQLWQGRLHALGGSKEDRCTPATEHWSIAVNDGKAVERTWRQEAPIPRGGPHRSSAVLNGKLYVFGGEEGDVRPHAGDPEFTCDWSTPLEVVYGDTFVLDSHADAWRQVASMPLPTTHTESCATIDDHFAILAGGNRNRRALSDAIQIYDADVDSWRVIERLPTCMKTCAAYYDGWLYLVTGQRSHSPTDLAPGDVLDSVWRTRFQT